MNIKQIAIFAVVFLLGGLFGGGIASSLKNKVAQVTG